MHAASFEMIEIPHLRQSARTRPTSAWWSTRSTFATPGARRHLRHRQRRLGLLAARLQAAREAKTVIGVGVKNSSSDLLINNCDEFTTTTTWCARTSRSGAGEEAQGSRACGEDKKQEAYDVVLETLNALIAERAQRRNLGLDGQAGPEAAQAGLQRVLLWVPRFLRLLEEMQQKGLVKLDPDEKSGGYSSGPRSRPPQSSPRQPARASGMSRSAAAGAVLRNQSRLYSAPRASLRASGNRFWLRSSRRVYAATAASFGAKPVVESGYGVTNLVNRATATADEWRLSNSSRAPALAAKLRRYRRRASSFSSWRLPSGFGRPRVRSVVSGDLRRARSGCSQPERFERELSARALVSCFGY